MALLPSGLGFTKADLTLKYDHMAVPMNDNTIQTVSVKDPYWSISISYPDSTRAEMREISTFLLSLGGQQTQFEVILPQYQQPQQGPIDATNVTIAEGQTGNTLVITDWQNSIGGVPGPQDIFKLSGSKKVYMIKSVDTSTANQLTLTIFPPIAEVTQVGESILFNNVPFSVKLAQKETPVLVMNMQGVYNSVSLDLVEDLTP